MKFLMDVIKEGGLEIDLEYSSSQRLQVAAIIPYLYFHNLTSGVFKLEVEKYAETIFSKEFSYLDIKKQETSSYLHVYHPVVCENPLPIEEGTYTFKIFPISGYEASGNSFLGWIKQHENIQVPMSYNPLSDVKNPYTIRFKEYRRIYS